MFARRLAPFGLAMLMSFGLASLTGCGPSQDEYDSAINKGKKLQSDLDAEKAAHAKTEEELKKTKADVEDLKKQVENYAELKKKLGDDKDSLFKQLEELKKKEAALRARAKALRGKLEALKAAKVSISFRRGQIVMGLPGDVLFAPGSEKLAKGGKDILLEIAKLIKSEPDLEKRRYQIVGHTDNGKYVGPFKDNVGLSVMRARDVYDFLTKTPDEKKKIEGAGLKSDSWSAAGFGEFDPIAGSLDKQSTEEKTKNRRVEIVIVPDASELLSGLDGDV